MIKHLKNFLPLLLIYSRVATGIVMLVLSILQIENYRYYAVCLLIFGLLTDIFDGIIARKMNISTTGLRRMDSTADQVFFVLVLIATFIHSPQFFTANKIELIILASFELTAYLVCFVKFQKEIATHAIASKIWTLLLVIAITQVIWTGASATLFQICFYSGVITRIEIIAIILLIRNWTNDVPSVYHAYLLRKGKAINRHKLFNG